MSSEVVVHDSLDGKVVPRDLLLAARLTNDEIYRRRHHVIHSQFARRVMNASHRVFVLVQYPMQEDMDQWFHVLEEDCESQVEVREMQMLAKLRFLHLLFLHDDEGWYDRLMTGCHLDELVVDPVLATPRTLLTLITRDVFSVVHLDDIGITSNHDQTKTVVHNRPTTYAHESLRFHSQWLKGRSFFVEQFSHTDLNVVSHDYFHRGFFRELRHAYPDVVSVTKKTEAFYQYEWKRLLHEEHVMKHFYALTNGSLVTACTLTRQDTEFVPVAAASEMDITSFEGGGGLFTALYCDAPFVGMTPDNFGQPRTLDVWRLSQIQDIHNSVMGRSIHSLRRISLRGESLSRLVLRISPQTMEMNTAISDTNQATYMPDECLNSGLFLDVKFQVEYCSIEDKRRAFARGYQMYFPYLLRPVCWRLVKKGCPRPIVEKHPYRNSKRAFEYYTDDDEAAKEAAQEMWKKFTNGFDRWWADAGSRVSKLMVLDDETFYVNQHSFHKVIMGHGRDAYFDTKRRVLSSSRGSYAADPVWPLVPDCRIYPCVTTPATVEHTDDENAKGRHHFGTWESLRVLSLRYGAFRERWQQMGGGYGDMLWRTLYQHVMEESHCCDAGSPYCHLGVAQRNWEMPRTADEQNIRYHKTFECEE